MRVSSVLACSLLVLALAAPPAQATGPLSMVKDINPAGSSNPQNLVGVGDLVYFSADDGSHGRELWRSDGTPGGTWMVADIRAGSAGSDPSRVYAAGSMLFFVANDGVHGRELWRSDGTAGGTAMVKNLSKGSRSTSFDNLTVVGAKLFFTAKSRLWVTNSTAAGTVALGAATDVRLTAAYAGKLYFTVGRTGNDVWRSDGTVAGTKPLKWAPTWIDQIATTSSLLYLLRGDTPSGPASALWKSAGTKASTLRLTDRLELDLPVDLTAAGDRVFFVNSYGFELWKSNGTSAGTKLVNDVGADIVGLTAAGSRIFFAVDTGNDWELWKSGGKARNTKVLADLETMWGPAELTAVGSDLCFYTVDYGTDNWTMWSSDGTVAGTQPVVTRAAADTHPTNLASSGGRLYFALDDGVSGGELWSYLP